MLTAEERILLQDYKKAFKTYFHHKGIVEVDRSISVKLNYAITSLEDVLPVLNYQAPPHRVSEYRILYIKQGTGNSKIASINLTIKDQTLMVIPAQTVTSADFGHGLTGYHLGFDLEFFWQPHFPSHHLLKLNVFDSAIIPYCYVGKRHGKYIEQIFEDLLDEHHHNRKNKEELIALKILQLIVICDRFFNTDEQLKKIAPSPTIVKYLNLVQKHFRENHSPGYYARKMHIHPNSLNAISRRYLGRSAKAAIDSMLLSEAKSLLTHTGISMKEVAYELGFSSPSQFFRFFKRSTGTSPAMYRKKQFETASN